MFKKISQDRVLSTFFHLISIGLNAFAFFNILQISSVIAQIVIGSFGASLVFLQIDSLRKWKTHRKSSYITTYVLCTIFSLLSTGYVITSLSTTKSTTRDLSIIDVSDNISTKVKSISRLDDANKQLAISIQDLGISKQVLLDNASFYGENFYTKRSQTEDKLSAIDRSIQEALDKKAANLKTITTIETDIGNLKTNKSELVANRNSDIFTTISNDLNISLTLLTGIVFLLLAAVLELGIFTLTPALHETLENDSILKDLLEKNDALETRLYATEKVKQPSKPTVNAYIDAVFASNSKKLNNRSTTARLTRFDVNICDNFHILLATTQGDQGVPFIQTAQGKGTYSVYSKEEIKEQLKIMKGAKRYAR